MALFLIDNIPYQLQDGEAGNLLQEWIDDLESVINDLGSLSFEPILSGSFSGLDGETQGIFEVAVSDSDLTDFYWRLAGLTKWMMKGYRKRLIRGMRKWRVLFQRKWMICFSGCPIRRFYQLPAPTPKSPLSPRGDFHAE